MRSAAAPLWFSFELQVINYNRECVLVRINQGDRQPPPHQRKGLQRPERDYVGLCFPKAPSDPDG